jgi:hypothetical protein
MTALAGSGLLLMSMTASAQYGAFSAYNPQQEQNERNTVSNDHIFDLLRSDLNLASSTAQPFAGDRSRVDLALDAVNNCQYAVRTGAYDKLTFGETIATIQRVVDLNRLTDQNRSYLASDMNQLREFETQLLGS